MNISIKTMLNMTEESNFELSKRLRAGLTSDKFKSAISKINKKCNHIDAYTYKLYVKLVDGLIGYYLDDFSSWSERKAFLDSVSNKFNAVILDSKKYPYYGLSVYDFLPNRVRYAINKELCGEEDGYCRIDTEFIHHYIDYYYLTGLLKDAVDIYQKTVDDRIIKNKVKDQNIVYFVRVLADFFLETIETPMYGALLDMVDAFYPGNEVNHERIVGIVRGLKK